MDSMSFSELYLSEMDSVMQCVNPHDVSPITASVNYAPAVKLEMEEFGDLAPFLSTTMLIPTGNSTDELDTPIFELKEPFEYVVNKNAKNQSAPDPLQFEYEPIEKVFSQSMPVALLEETNKPFIDYSTYTNIIEGSDQITMPFSPTSAEIPHGSYLFNTINNLNNHNTEKETLVEIQRNDENNMRATQYIYYDDNHSVVSLTSNENQYSNVSSPIDLNDYAPKQPHLGIVTPDDSNSSQSARERPKLDFNFTAFLANTTLNTPDVINSVVDLESQFNILSYVNDENVVNVQQNPSTSRDPLSVPFSTSSSKSKRRKRYDDDDEDYVPPAKKASNARRKAAKYSVESSDDEEDLESEEEAAADIPAKRGRPARRVSSISSEHSDASKYRELRDKNNEASRKSRLKRKKKEQVLEDECDDLEMRNTKLKVRVEQLEKMVNNFRKDLFKIMIKK